MDEIPEVVASADGENKEQEVVTVTGSEEHDFLKGIGAERAVEDQVSDILRKVTLTHHGPNTRREQLQKEQEAMPKL